MRMGRAFRHCAFILAIGVINGKPSHAATTKLPVIPVCDVKALGKSRGGISITILGRYIWHAHGEYLDDPNCENLVPLQFPEERSKDSGLEQLSPQNLSAKFKSAKGAIYCVCTGKLLTSSGLDYLLLEKVQGCFASEHSPLSSMSGR